MKKLIIIALLSILVVYSCKTPDTTKLNISGEWTIELDSTDVGLDKGWEKKLFSQKINLPGTTDDAGLGNPNTLKPALTKPQLNRLTRKNSYIGAAWYSREISIPQDWDNSNFILKLERILWLSDVWVDGKKVEKTGNSLTTPHRYDLTNYLSAGNKHILTVRIDNRKQYEISGGNLGHSYTNDTQIMWNGILGDMYIEKLPTTYVSNLQVYPSIENKNVKVKLEVNNTSRAEKTTEICLTAIDKKTGEKKKTVTESRKIEVGSSTIELMYDMGSDMKLWSEFTPDVYEMKAELKDNDNLSVLSTDFGMRKISHNGNQLFINNNPLFLRGTLECNVFPLTGYPPMQKEGWRKVMETAREWGLNHLRFHSWCPPKAAFEVADEMGFYLQVELPVWSTSIGEDVPTVDFLYQEADRIRAEYGNHPSFTMWCLGNELEGDMSILSEMIQALKKKDDRHLYSMTAYTFQHGYGQWPQPVEDYFITQYTKQGWVRGQGVFNAQSPTFDKDFNTSVEGMTVPLVTHEIGQYAVYPNLEEIKKYTGVLEPINFIAVKEDLTKKGLIDKAPLYTKASGKLAAILYKEEIERAMKTAGISGYQLLDLHDFPGQGTALVGLLDAFWDSKGVVTAEEFRQFSSPIVPLLRFPKAVYKNDEDFVATLDISNYWNEDLRDQVVEWKILDKEKEVASGNSKVNAKIGYNHHVIDVKASLANVQKASELRVKVSLQGTDYKNEWKIWVYPAEQKVNFGDVLYTRNKAEALKALEQGKKVLLNPDWKKISGIEGKFVPVFWSPVHFPAQAGTMGLLCDPQHKVFANFPTDMHTDWQWWNLNIHSTTMIVDSIDGGQALVEMVDNFTNNRRLASLYEGSIGNGKLMIASFDLDNDLDQRIVAKQMLISILEYMHSDSFSPKRITNTESLDMILKEK